ncbi:hypothetical protein [Sphingobium sp. CAP-1]|uniref:hypothetical protein n=1 Tax=Sphingobium sp. CAP-1 TaxID=2676077 RepID=UPI0012BB44C8|nr:hypothetical protein [Sphingobium sp. CAP-1]QGP80916.1 hypothetical protein GL174_17740 [Sphingobium sp. CAP-1]
MTMSKRCRIAFLLLLATTASSGYAWEKVCRGDCTFEGVDKVFPDQYQNPVYEDQTLDFKLWGNFIDVGAGVGVLSGPSGTSATLTGSEGGLPMGRIRFRLAVPKVTAATSMTIRHKTNGNWDSRTLRLGVVPRNAGELPLAEAKVEMTSADRTCLLQAGGNVETLNNGGTLRITLPAGHQTQMPGCLGSTIGLRFTGRSEAGTAQRFSPTLAGGGDLRSGAIANPAPLSGFASLRSMAAQDASINAELSTQAVGRVTEAQILAFVMKSGGSMKLPKVQIVPNAVIGIRELIVTPQPVLAGNPLTFEMHLSARAPAGGLKVSYRVNRSACFASEDTPYDATAGAINNIIVPANTDIARITLRTRADGGAACASEPTPTEHNIELWTVEPNITSGPGFLRRPFQLLARPAN